MAENLRDKTIKGTMWSFIDSFASQGITFLVGLVLARLLTPEEYGLIGIIIIFIAIFNTIVDSGFSNALIRKKNAVDIDYNTVFISNMAVSIVMFLGMFFASPHIASFFKEPQLDALCKAMSIIIIINAFAIIQRTILVKNIDFKTQTKVSLTATIASGVIGIGMAFYGFGIWSLVGQQISHRLINSVMLWTYTSWYPKMEFSKASFKEMFSFSWKLLVSSLIDTIWKEVYQVVIGKCYSTATLGQYTRASQFGRIFSSNLTTIIQRVSYPVLSTIQDDKERMKQAYRKLIRTSMFITLICMSVLAAISKPMILVLIGEKWLLAATLLPLICLRSFMYPLHALNLNMLQVAGRSDLFLRIEIYKKCIAVIPILIGIYFNIYYMLWGSIIGGLFAYYINAKYSKKLIGYGIIQQIKDIMPSIILSVIISFATYLVSYIPLSAFLILPLQIFVAIAITISICEAIKYNEYSELKDIARKLFAKK